MEIPPTTLHQVRCAPRSAGLAGLLATGLALAGWLTASPRSASAADQAVTIVDFAFQPATVTITAGEIVTWTNRGTVDHTVTSDDGTTMVSGPLTPGSSFANLFGVPGTYRYHCAIHSQMHGAVVVEPAPPTATPNGPPTSSPPPGTLPPGFSPNPVITALPEATPSPVQTPIGSPAPDGSGGLINLATLGLIGVVAATTVAFLLLVVSRRRPNR